MGRSRRKYKQSRAKVRVGLPKKNPRVFKPAFDLPPKLRSLIDPTRTKWDQKGSVISNYKQFGVVSNPNLLGVRSRTRHIVESDSLQVPPPPCSNPAETAVDEFEPIDSGSDLEEDEVGEEMGRSRRKYKQSRAKVRVGLPKKNPRVFKPAFDLPPKLRSLIDPTRTKWDEKGSVISNYKQFGVVSNPNLLGVRSRTPHIVESDSLQVPPPPCSNPAETAVDEFEPIDSGSDLEEDDLKTALGKKRKDGKTAPLQPLTSMQRVHICRLIKKYGEDYESMFRDRKLNAMQHSIGTLRNLCRRYQQWEDKNPLILAK
ncbi:hypothetical protein Nepgr_022280 [Nepenthes gracilis]|uniref:Nucleolar protein 16 n=1 Tax=Nepenthes gracilis TaxID=150966 RepID=A0AAD3T0F8_NEPGR|nr:hypothetical protein Nepgr_022280 [Nepenthes gracilis]